MCRAGRWICDLWGGLGFVFLSAAGYARPGGEFLEAERGNYGQYAGLDRWRSCRRSPGRIHRHSRHRISQEMEPQTIEDCAKVAIEKMENSWEDLYEANREG